MDDERLIVAVRCRELIYNKADKNHSNRELLQKAWESIATEMGNEATAAACKTRWTSLRDYFLRKHKEIKQTVSGQGASKKKKWPLYDYMQFLLPGCSTGTSSSNLPDDEESNSSHSDDDIEQSSQANPSLQTVDTQSSSLGVSNTQQRRKRNAANSRNSEIDREILRAFNTPQQQPREVDDNEHFFKSLLPAMKNLDTLQTMRFRMDVQRLLVNYLEQAPSRTSTNITSPAHLPHASSSGRSSAPLMGQFSSEPYQPYGTPQRSTSNATSPAESVYGHDTYFTQGSQY